jgi:hypothetical protein
MDWKLGDCAAHGLRPRRMFPGTAIYYVAVVVDFVLRFAWTATLVPHWFSSFGDSDGLHGVPTWVPQALLPLVAAGEILRRTMWAIFRLETEHLHNTEGFRRVDLIPLHFDHAPEEQQSETKERRPATGMLIELLFYVLVVTLLGWAAWTREIRGDTVTAPALYGTR